MRVEREKTIRLPEYPGQTGVGRDAVDLIRRVGIYRLGGYDGCRCTHFTVLNFTVSVSCHKSEHTVRVTCPSLGCVPQEMADVASEVLRQMEEDSPTAEYRVRLCDYGYDRPPKCCYCGKPREDADGYLCAECLVGMSAWNRPIIKDHDYQNAVVVRPTPTDEP